ncbi:MAG: lysophospholipid acyltransferase family protein, partial [Vicinamibacteria bacterium]
TSVAVFPEGTRSFDGVMRPFRKGSFRLALKAASPVVPLSISGSHLVMKRGEVTVYPRKVRLTIGEPMLVDGLTEADAGALSERVRDVVRKKLELSASPG